ncbi:hypothetical protein CRM22_004135 [Opisthorchis felineus]|uniref:EF-hand domain-containing protein n=1 Tax=Opisthorchis felineus TaxID=147828 RepID=A0A4S2M441_OPIFE|nr:hypothetical protein CRM22_004135 [Opisthorchis felineus]
MENPFRDAFYAYAKTRRGLVTLNYEMIEAMLTRAGLFTPPAFNESVFQREFKRAYGNTESKERDFQDFTDVCKKVISPCLAKARNISPDEAFKIIQEELIAKQPKSASERIIK